MEILVLYTFIPVPVRLVVEHYGKFSSTDDAHLY
jgi:hypothetical protein